MKTESTMEMCSEWLHYADYGRNSAQMREYIYYVCTYIYMYMYIYTHIYVKFSLEMAASSSSAMVPQNAPFCSLLK